MKGLLAAAAAVLTLAGTGGALAGSAAAPPTKTSGVLTVGLDPPAVNFQVGTLRGTKVLNPKGYEVDLAKAIAAKLGISKITWVHVPFTGLFRPGPKPFDLAFEESTITTTRKQAVDFSTPYFKANQGVLVSKGTTPPKSLAELRKLQRRRRRASPSCASSRRAARPSPPASTTSRRSCTRTKRRSSTRRRPPRSPRLRWDAARPS